MSTPISNEGLKRVVGVSGLSLNIVNCTIGAGIFALPAIVSIQLGAFSIYSYLFCGLMMAAIMFCYAEIGTKVTSSGGSFAYVEAAFGIFPGYIVTWLYFFGWSVLGSAALLNLAGDSLGVIFPIFSDRVFRAFFIFILLSTIVAINVRGAKEGIGFIKFITIIKLLPLLGIIIFGFSKIDTTNLQWDQLPSITTFGNTALILFFAFAGFEASLNVSGELKTPQRTVPLGILFGGSLVLVIYLLLQTVTYGILGEGIAAFEDAPLAAVAESIIGPLGATILLFAAAISCFGTVSSDVMSTPRLLFAGAHDGFFPKFLGNVHTRFSTPHLAIIVYGALIFIFSVFGGFKQLAVLASSAILIVYLLVIFATIKLRKQKSELPGKLFKAPGGLLFPIIGIASIIWLLTSLTKKEMLSAAIFIAIICIFYLVMKKMKK